MEKIDEAKEIKRLAKQIEEPKKETKKLRLIKNSYKTDGKELKQFKVTVPSKFLDLIKLNEDNAIVLAGLDKKENKITIEIKKNG
jgi:Tfp pilus assembly protein PilN